MSDETPVVQAVEQLPIPLFDGVVLAARTNDGQIHLSLRDLCTTIGPDTASQRRRIRANESLHLTALPAAQYDDAIRFIKEQYRSLTGKEIDAVEQSGLDLECA